MAMMLLAACPSAHALLAPQFDPKVQPQKQPWGDECDEILRVAQLKAKKQPHVRPCFVPHKDIVVPPAPYEDKLHTEYLDPQYKQPERNVTFFFAGALPELSQEGQWKRKVVTNADEPGIQVGSGGRSWAPPLPRSPVVEQGRATRLGRPRDHQLSLSVAASTKHSPTLQAGYSYGARQTVARLFGELPGYVITAHHIGNYQQMLSSSKFCLAPPGWGWGGRMKVAVMHGCVPVIIQVRRRCRPAAQQCTGACPGHCSAVRVQARRAGQCRAPGFADSAHGCCAPACLSSQDGIVVEWEEQLPLQEYAIRIPTRFVHRLPEFLEEFEAAGRLAHAQKALQCAWRLHMWQRPHGRGFELAMCELKARLLGQKVRLDTEACRLYCGDATPVDFSAINSL